MDGQRGVVGIAASAGGLAALSAVLSRLPADFALPILVVEHQLPGSESTLASILDKRTPLRVKQAENGESLVGGTVYIAPPDHHMLLDAKRCIELVETAPVDFQRPSANVLFASLAEHADCAAVVVVLSGMRKDGATGVVAVKKAGGRVMAQDEATSEFFGMPGAAIATGVVDRILPLDSIGPVLAAMATKEAVA